MKQKRRFAVLLAALALAAGLLSVPVLATEGDTPSVYTEMPGESTGGETSSESQVTEPTSPPEPVETPQPEPTEEPSSSSSEPSSSSSEEPWDEPSSQPTEEPSSSDSWEDPSSSSEDPWEDPSSSSDDPWTEPTEEPWQPSSSQEENTAGGITNQAPEVQEPEAIATPRPAVERPSVSLNTGGSSSQDEEEDSGPNYVTFAQLNVRGNSMAATLFLGGVGCIALGVLGLVTILILYLRGRRRYAGTEGILEEIQEAEARQRPAEQPPVQEQMPPPPPPVQSPPPGAIMPEEASLYTEEFSLPPEEAYPEEAYPQEADYGYEDQEYREEDYGESYSQYRDEYEPDAYYDEGDYYGPQDGEYGGYAQEYPEEPAYPKGGDYGYQEPPAAPSSGRPSPQQQATQQFDTEEILREALRYTDEDYWDDSSQQ